MWVTVEKSGGHVLKIPRDTLNRSCSIKFALFGVFFPHLSLQGDFIPHITSQRRNIPLCRSDQGAAYLALKKKSRRKLHIMQRSESLLMTYSVKCTGRYTQQGETLLVELRQGEIMREK